MILKIVLIFLLSLSVFSSETIVRVPLKALPSNLELDKLINMDQTKVAGMLVDGLIEIGENLKFNPRLMKESKWKNNQKTLEIKLGKHFFSDASPITSKQLIKSLTDCIKRSKRLPLTSFRQIIGYKNFISNKSKTLEGLKVIDSETIQFNTKKYAPRIIDNLHHVSCSALKATKNSNDLLKGAIGSGPYQLQKNSDQNSLVLVKRNKFFGKKSGPDKIIYTSNNDFGNYEKMKNKFDLIELKEDPGPTPEFNRYKSSSLATYQLGFNNSKKPFDNEKLRKAVELAIDYKLLSEKMKWSSSRMQKGLFPYGMSGFIKRNLEKRNYLEANKILKSLGYSEKKPFRFIILTSMRKNIEKEIKLWPKLFNKSFIKVEVKLLEHKELVKRKEAGDFEVIRYTKYAGSLEPDILLGSYLSTSVYNTPRAKQKECDTKINTAVNENNSSKRNKLYQIAGKCLIDHQVIVPLASHNSGLVLIRKPWRLRRTNQYMLYSYFINEWIKE